jgi:hypothetical protein
LKISARTKQKLILKSQKRDLSFQSNTALLHGSDSTKSFKIYVIKVKNKRKII